MKFNEVITELEDMLDQYGLREIVNALSQISYEKAEHLRTNWQDESTAKEWDKTAVYLERVANTKAVHNCPLN